MTEKIVIERLDYEGILEQTVLIYLGDGIYAEPQEFSGNQGESSNTNNHVCGWIHFQPALRAGGQNIGERGYHPRLPQPTQIKT